MHCIFWNLWYNLSCIPKGGKKQAHRNTVRLFLFSYRKDLVTLKRESIFPIREKYGCALVRIEDVTA